MRVELIQISDIDGIRANKTPMIEKMPQRRDDYFKTDHLRDHLKTHAVRSGGVSIASRIAATVIQMVGVVILARLLTPADFGLVAMVTAITEIFNVFKDLGLYDATIQQPHLNHEQVSTLFWINVGFGFVLTATLIAISPAIAWFYHKPELKVITVVSSLSFIFTGLSAQHLALLKRRMSFMSVSIIDVSATLVSTIAAIIFALIGFGYWSIVLRQVVLGLFIAIGAWIFCVWRPGRPARKSGIGGMLRFGANTLGYFVMNYFSTNLDKTLVGKKYGAEPLGFYSRANYLATVPGGQLSMSIFHVAVATLSKLREDPPKFRRYYLSAISSISFVGMPMSGFMVVVSRDLIYLILGPQWGRAVPLFSILGLAAGMYLLASTHGWLHVSLGRADRWMRWGVFSSVITVAGFVVGLFFGTAGVATGYTVTVIFLAPLSILYAGKPIGLRFRELFSSLWRYLAGALLTSLLCSFLFNTIHFSSSVLLNILISSVIYVAIYLLIITALFLSVRPIVEFISLSQMMLQGLRPNKVS